MGRFFLLFPGKNLLSFLPFLPSFCCTKTFPPLWFAFRPKYFTYPKFPLSPPCVLFLLLGPNVFPNFLPLGFSSVAWHQICKPLLDAKVSFYHLMRRQWPLKIVENEYIKLYREFSKSPKQQKTKPVDEYKPKYIHHKESDLKVFLTMKEHDAALSENVVSLLTQVLHWWHHKRTRCTIR